MAVFFGEYLTYHRSGEATRTVKAPASTSTEAPAQEK